MLIVSGHLLVEPADRAAYLDACTDVVRQARTASGCLDFALSPDLIDPGRINVYEAWESEAQLLAFRGAGEPPSDTPPIKDAQVMRHEVAASGPP